MNSRAKFLTVLAVISALLVISFLPGGARDADVVVLGFYHENQVFDNPRHVRTHANGVDFISNENREVHFVGPYRVEYPSPQTR